MSNKQPKGPVGQVFVSAVLAERIQRTKMESVDIFGAGSPVVYAEPGADRVRLIRQLYFTLFFRDPRPGGHSLRILLRDDAGAGRLEISFPPVEHTRASDIEARVEKVDFTFPPRTHYLCIEVDGRDRFVTPIIVLTKGTVT